MEHTIRKGATLPELVLFFMDNPEMDKKLLDANGTITIEEVVTRRKITLCKPLIFDDTPCSDCEDCPNPTRIIYKFDKKDTQYTGTFKATITINFRNGDVLILPIKEDLMIHVV